MVKRNTFLRERKGAVLRYFEFTIFFLRAQEFRPVAGIVLDQGIRISLDRFRVGVPQRLARHILVRDHISVDRQTDRVRRGD